MFPLLLITKTHSNLSRTLLNPENQDTHVYQKSCLSKAGSFGNNGARVLSQGNGGVLQTSGSHVFLDHTAHYLFKVHTAKSFDPTVMSKNLA